MLKAALDKLYWVVPGGLHGSRLTKAAIEGDMDKVPPQVMSKYLTSPCYASTNLNPKTLVWDIHKSFVGSAMGFYSFPETTPLHLAVYFDNVKQLRLTGAMYDCVDGNGNTIVHIAAAFGRLGSIKEFLTAADLQKENKHSITPIHSLLHEQDGDPRALADILTVNLLTDTTGGLPPLLGLLQSCDKIAIVPIELDFPDKYKGFFPDEWWCKSKAVFAQKNSLQKPSSEVSALDIF